MAIVQTTYSSPLGTMLITCDSLRLLSVGFPSEDMVQTPHYGGGENPLLECTQRWLNCYFEGHQPDFYPPMDLRGTVFDMLVWNLLLEIPYGSTVTYADLAREVDRRMERATMSPRAVGGAVGRNPIAIMVPCHRVIGSGGKTGGYAWGISRKLYLLDWECRNALQSMPKMK